MSKIYLILLVCFTFLFYKQEHREWPKYTYALWIPFLWLICFTTRLTTIFLPIGGEFPGGPSIQGALEGNPISRNIAVAMILAGLVVYIKRQNAFSDLFRANRGILILYAYVLLSIIWSDFPEASLKRFIRISGAFLMALIVASEEDHHKALEHVIRRYIALFIPLSFFFIKTDRSIGYIIGVHGEHFMAGIGNHKNDLGAVCMFALLFLLMRALRLWPRINYLDGILAMIAGYLLIRARSMTAIVLAVLGTALIIGMKLADGNLRKISIMILVVVIVALPFLMLAMNSPGNVISGAFFSATGKDATLSGRIPMWKDLIRIGKKEIVRGSGYESFWAKHYNEIWATWTFLPINAHNGYVEVLLNLGLIGLFIIIIVIGEALAILGSTKQLSQPYGQWLFVVVLIIIFNNVTEAWLVNLSLGWCVFLLIMVNSGKDKRLWQFQSDKTAAENES